MATRRLAAGLAAAVVSAGAMGGGADCNDGDLDLSGAVDSADLNILLGDFGCREGCAGDVTGDGVTDSLDLNALLSVFGAACGPGSCCEVTGTPGCDDLFCEEFVCMLDPSCCEAAWDIECVITANFWCGLCDSYGPCCLGDDTCAELFVDECASMGGMPVEAEVCDLVYCGTPPAPCGEPGLGACWPGGNGTPGCEQEACCGEVCELDPFCCEMLWDEACADLGCEINCYACGCCAP